MAGFMAGFGAAVSKGIDRGVELKAKKEEDAFKFSFQNYLDRKEKLTKKEEEQAKLATRAKEYAGLYGHDESTAKEIYNWLDAGVPDSVINDRLENYNFVAIEQTPKTAKPSTDEQMQISGMANPSRDPAASIPAETGQVQGIQTGNGNALDAAAQRSIRRIAELSGDSEESIGNVLSGKYRTAPDIGDGKVGSFKLVKKDVPKDKLTDADVASEYTRLQMDVANGKPGAETALKVFETVKMPAYLKAKSSLETPTGDNVLPDLIYKMGRETDPERKRMFAQQIEAHRRAQELKSGKEDGSSKMGVVFLPDGSTDIQRVRRIRDEEGNQFWVRRAADGDYEKVTGDVQLIDEDQRKEIGNILTERTNDIVKFEEKMANTADAVRMTDQVFKIVDSDKRVLTTTAGMARKVTGATREIFTGIDVLKDVAERNGAITEDDVERALGGSITDIEKRVDEALGQGVTDLAEKRALLDSKILLSGFRLGGLEGQSGNGLSNQDFDRILSIVDSSSNPDTFKRTWAQYVKGRIQQVDMKADIANNHNARIDAFQELNGFRPVDKVVTTLTDYINEKGDPELVNGLNQIDQWSSSMVDPSSGSMGAPKAPAMEQPKTANQPRQDGGSERVLGKSAKTGKTIVEITYPDGTTKRVAR